MDGQEIFKENELAREVKEGMYGTYYLGKVKLPWKYRCTVPYPQLWYMKSSENKVFGKIYFMVTFDLTDVRLFIQFISLGINSNSFPRRNTNVFDFRVLPQTSRGFWGTYWIFICTSLPFYNPKILNSDISCLKVRPT